MPSYSYVLAASGGSASGFAALASLAYEPDHAGYGLARMIAQYIPAVRLRSMLEILLDGEAAVGGGGVGPTGIQSIEDVAWQLYTERGLVPILDGGPAVGEQLDVLGEIVGLKRLDAFFGNDDIYRMALAIKIKINKSHGTAEDLLEIVTLIGDLMVAAGGATSMVSRCIDFPDSLWTELCPCDADFIEAFWTYIVRAKPAGFRWDFVWLDQYEDDVFTYSSTLDATETDVGRGYGDLTLPNPATGGRYCGSFTS